MNISACGNVSIQGGRDVLIAEGDIKVLLREESEANQQEVLEVLNKLQEALRAKDEGKAATLMDTVWKLVPSVAGSVVSKFLCSVLFK